MMPLHLEMSQLGKKKKKKKLVCEINVWKNAGAYLCPAFVFVIFEVHENNLPSNKLVFLLHYLVKTIFLGVHGR